MTRPAATPAPQFDGFVMLAGMRTGSNFLEANLNTLPGLHCHGEAFNAYFIGKKDQTALFGIDMAAREADPLALLDAMRANTDGMPGFRFFHDHDPRVLSRVLPDPRWAKIVLGRNPVESFVSWKIAQGTGQWKLSNAKNLRQVQVPFDATEFVAHLDAARSFRGAVMRGLQISGQTAFFLDYDDLRDLDVLNGLAAFLGVPARLKALDAALKKQNPGPIAGKVTNPDEMAAALAMVDWAGLSRIPDFEARRPPMIPRYVAVAGAPLLFQPVPGGPDGVVTDWLARLGTGGLVHGFDQRSLRQWKREAGAHRSFTVLRHPLPRAHAAFCATVLTDALPQVRGALIRLHRLPLGRPDAPMTLPDHRAAFLGFLRFLKLNLAGQTSIRTLPEWASQLAVLQGFAQLQPPDVVLREDRLAEGLAYLAAETGVAMPPLPKPAPDDAQWSLADVADEACTAAAREAYGRDYAAFGFGDWRAG